ncbi:MAG: hypothetical protein ACTSYI_16060 [Promethearchaeota archaeon]
MAKLLLTELFDVVDLPTKVQEKWKYLVNFKKRGKPPRIFLSEPMFGGFDPDYVILAIIGRGKMRRTCSGYVYNGMHPQLSEMGDIYVTPNFKYRVTDEHIWQATLTNFEEEIVLG